MQVTLDENPVIGQDLDHFDDLLRRRPTEINDIGEGEIHIGRVRRVEELPNRVNGAGV